MVFGTCGCESECRHLCKEKPPHGEGAIDQAQASAGAWHGLVGFGKVSSSLISKFDRQQGFKGKYSLKTGAIETEQ
jgi:hypothetical protein